MFTIFVLISPCYNANNYPYRLCFFFVVCPWKWWQNILQKRDIPKNELHKMPFPSYLLHAKAALTSYLSFSYVRIHQIFEPLHPYNDAPSNSLKDSNANPKVKTMEEGVRAQSLAYNTFRVKGVRQSFEMGTRMIDKHVNYSYQFAQTKK